MSACDFRRAPIPPAVLMILASAVFRATAITGSVITDNFDTSHDYLAGGVAGTAWSGLYTGVGSFPGGSYGMAPGSNLTANANLSNPGQLTVQTANAGWDMTEDDGFFLFMNASGNFQMSVQIIVPYSTSQYNQAGLLVRAANPDGSPFGGAENWVSFVRFDEFGVSTMFDSTVNGQTGRTTLPLPDPNYWLRINRVNGSTFNFYERAQASDPWQLVGPSISRPDLAGLALQVGITQGTFSSNSPQVEFDNFSLTLVPEPGAGLLSATGLAMAVLLVQSRGRAFAKRQIG